MVDESKLVLGAAAALLFTALICIVFPLFCVVVPVLLAIVYFLNQNPQAPPDTVKAFFSGFRFGGHRGSPFSFPENSMSGFEQARQEGADLVEFDLCLSKDGKAVLMHDDTIDRTTNMTGAVGQLTYDQLMNASLHTKFTRHTKSPAHGNVNSEKIPTLEAAIQWGVKNNIRMLFDVKDHSPEMIAILVKYFADYNLYERGIICSFFPWVVYKVKRSDPKIITGLTWRKGFFAFADLERSVPRYSGLLHYAALLVDLTYISVLNSALPPFVGADLMLTHEKEISGGYVDEMRARNIRVVAWTVNDILQAQWMLESLKIPILTDFPFHSKELKALSKFALSGFE